MRQRRRWLLATGRWGQCLFQYFETKCNQDFFPDKFARSWLPVGFDVECQLLNYSLRKAQATCVKSCALILDNFPVAWYTAEHFAMPRYKSCKVERQSVWNAGNQSFWGQLPTAPTHLVPCLYVTRFFSKFLQISPNFSKFHQISPKLTKVQK